MSETLSVDNDPVDVSLSTPDDPNPSVWINHTVTVDATASAGPSGVGGMNCSVDREAPQPYSPGAVTVNGDGPHTVSCTAWNNAIDPQDSRATGTTSVAIHIDEAPPTLSFEPENPSDPTGLVVDRADSESGVAGGSIEKAPAGTNDWTQLATSFDGAHLLADFDDSGLTGPYVFRATSCDKVGNCASTSEQLTLPVRIPSASDVSFKPIANPWRPTLVRERVRVGWHWAKTRHHGRLVAVKRGGRTITIEVLKLVERCVTKRVRVAKHRWRTERTCRTPRLT